MNRRHFLTAALGTSLATAIRSVCTAAQSPRSPIVDTHVHCFAGKDDARFPYHPQGPYQPEQPATPERLLTRMIESGVDYAIIVHPEPYQDDHSYLEHCLDVGQGKLKGTCLFFADRPGTAERMRHLVGSRQGQIVAARIHAYAPDRLPPFNTPQLKQFWSQVTDLGLAVQLHFEPRYAPGFEPLIRSFPSTKVIIDHLGRPFQGTHEEHTVVVRWARFPNTIMKLSSLPPREQYPHRDVGPIVQRLADAYGAQRLIYGGGFSAEATAASYRAYRERLLAYLPKFSDDDRAKVFGVNAARLFGFEETERKG